MKIVLIFLVVCLLFYILWISGYLIMNLSKNHSYQFSFSSDITKGTAIAEIQDKNKNVLFFLDNIHPVQNLDASQISRYYLVFRFQKADGTICLEWKEL